MFVRSLRLCALAVPLFMCACGGVADEQPIRTVHPWVDVKPSALEPVTTAGTLTTTSSAPHLTFYGGRVVSNMQVVQVIWGQGSYLSNVTSSASPSVATFFQGVLNSGYVDWLTEYNTPTQTIGRGSFKGQYTITPSTSATTIDDSVIRAELSAQIAAGSLPAPSLDAKGNSNTYYAVFFPHGRIITQGSMRSCQAGGFCAYHGTLAASGTRQEAYYGVHPDMQAGSGCDLGCGSSSNAFSNLTSVASHEMIETITDPEVGLATSYGPPLGWYDGTNGEIGDICNAQQDSVIGSDGVTYTVQKEFSNAQNGCITTKAPTADFSLAVAQLTGSIAAGTVASTSVTTAVTAGTAQAITLSVTGLPTGVTAAFTPASVTAGASSALKLTTLATTTPGTYALTVVGKAGTITHSVALALTVTGNTFSFSLSPASLSVAAGARGTSTIATTISSGVTQSVALSVTGLPSGVTAAFSAATVNAGASSTLTLTSTLAAAQGTFPLVISGKGANGSTHTETLSLTITGNNFTLSTTPTSLTVKAGGTASADVVTTISSGVTQTVTLSLTGLPAGVTAKLGSTTVASGAKTTLTLTGATTAASGTATLTLTGTAPSGGTKTTTIALTVVGNDFSLASSVTALTIANGKNATATLSTTLTTGVAQSIALSATGAPSGTAVSFAPTSVTTGAASVATITVGSTTSSGTYTITITAKGATATHTLTVTLTVPAAAPTGIVNGGFESQLTGWTLTGTPALATPGHTGIALFEYSATSATIETTVSQTFTVPAGKTKLSFWYQTNCFDTVTFDWVSASLKNNSTGAVTMPLAKTCSANANWLNVVVPVTAGTSYTLTLLNHDDPAGQGPTFTAWDDVAFQ